MAHLPYFQFYPADWIQDTQVLSLEAQGAWIKILCALHTASERGRKTSDTRQWKQFLGYPDDDRALDLLIELDGVANIYASDPDGNCSNLVNSVEITIESRRMLRDEAKRIQELERKRRYEGEHPTRHRRPSDGNPTPRDQRSEIRSKEEDTLAQSAPAQPNGFASFWVLYPRKKSKGDAEKVWKAIKPNAELEAAILKGLNRARGSQDWQKDQGQYIPYPATWLRAKGWEDETLIKFDIPKPAAQPALDLGKRATSEELARVHDLVQSTVHQLSRKTKMG